jgi:GNAT superfamily N-acetyltransferase
MDLSKQTEDPRAEFELEVGRLRPEEHAAYCAAMGQYPTCIEWQHERGAVCFVVKHNGEFVARVWVAEGRRYPLVYIGRDLNLGADEVLLVNPFTRPEYQGKRVMGALLEGVGRHYREQGRRWVYTAVFGYHREWVQVFAEAGFAIREVLGYYRLIGHRRDFERHVA